MSLQDIKQILSRIIVLNKNLDENRLNNLLEASGWEKQNKEEALSIFKILGAKEGVDVRRQQSEDAKQTVNNLAQETHKELSTEVIDQELVVAPKNELSAEVNGENVINFIPNNLPIKEEVEPGIIPSDDKVLEVAEVINIVPEKILGAKSDEDARSQQAEDVKLICEGINWAVWLAVILILFLVVFGYMYSNGIIK